MEKLLKVKYVSLPNLIVGNSVVPELLLHLCTPDSIARELSPLLQNSPRREWQLSGYKNMRRRLGNYVASEYAAELIADSIGLTEPDKEEKTDENPSSGGRREADSDAPRREGRRCRKPAPRKDAPANEAPKDNGKKPVKPEGGKDAAKPEGGKAAPKPEGNKAAPKPEGSKDSAKPDNNKDSESRRRRNHRRRRPSVPEGGLSKNL